MDKEKTFIIAVAHQKGGTGKTTTVCNLAACLGMASDSIRIAVIDLDAQGTATSHLNGARHFSSGSYQVIVGGKTIPEVALPTGIKNCFIVPSTNSLVLCEMDSILRGLSFGEVRENLLNGADAFDVLVMDCPSGLGIISTMAIAAADLVVMPTPPLAFAEEPLRATVAYINDLQKSADSKITIVVTMYKPEINSQNRHVGQIRNEWGEMVSDVEIPFETLVEDAVENNAVIVEFEKSSATAVAYIKLTENIGRHFGLELDISRLSVNSLGTDLAHGLGKLIKPQTEARLHVPPNEETSNTETTLPVSPPPTHESSTEDVSKAKDNLFQNSPQRVEGRSSPGRAEKLPEHSGEIQESENHYPHGSANNKAGISKFAYRTVAYIILILSFLVVSIFIP